MENKKTNEEIIRDLDEWNYKRLRHKGFSHEEALQSIEIGKKQADLINKEYQEKDKLAQAKLERKQSSEWQEFHAYYRNKAIKYFLQLIIWGGLLIYFSIPKDGAHFDPYVILENAGFLFLFGVLFLIIGLISKIFGNILIGIIGGLFLFFTVAEKFTELMENQGLSIAQQNSAFGILGLIYLLGVFILFIINFRNSRL